MADTTPIFADLPGAPFKIGQNVKVFRLADDTVGCSFLGRTGTVAYFEYNCGCGQSFPKDPMVGVRFANGELEEFWRDELSARRGPFKKVRA